MSGADRVTIQDQGQSVKGIGGNKKVSDLISANVKIQWNGTAGKVDGNIHHVTDYTEFGPSESDGHYFPLSLDKQYTGKQITCQGTKPKTAQDLDWVLKVDNCKKFTFSADGQEILSLDFSSATLDE